MIAQVIVRGGVSVGDRNLSDLSPKELFDETIGDKGMLVDSGFETICGKRIPWVKVVFRQSGFLKMAKPDQMRIAMSMEERSKPFPI
jgi:hypothetical protein